MLRFLRNHFHPTLGFKLGFMVLVSTGLIFFFTFGYYSRVVRRHMLEAVEENTRNLARSAVNRIDAVLQAVEPLPQLIARQVSSGRPSDGEIIAMLEHELACSTHIYGSAVARDPGVFPSNSPPAVPYVYHKAEGIGMANLAEAAYDYTSQDWYMIPRETGKPAWTDPYFDEGGGEAMMCTYVVPFYYNISTNPAAGAMAASNGNRVFAGVVGADLILDHLAETVARIKLYEHGYAFLLSQNGQIISHPNPEYLFKESIFSLADEKGDMEWRDLGRKMLRGGEGFVRLRSLKDRAPVWVYYAPVSSGWSVGILFPEEDVLAGLRHMRHVVYWIGAIGFAVLLLVISLLSLRVTRPIHALAKQTEAIAHGNLNLPVPPPESSDEVGLLSRSFENMRVALCEYVANLAATTAAKERIESELKIAQAIQRSFLPKRFPPFPDHDEFEIYAELQAAKAVGGDLYDYFLLDQHRLFFAIGDVSGKGVPAALFMAVTKTLLKGVAEQYVLPSQVLEKVNHELYVDNEQMMFVSVCCGMLDYQTGLLHYTNAGHLPPLRLRRPQSATWVALPKGSLLGINEAPVYRTMSLQLEPMDTLLLYTDGVTEAMNVKQELFGEDRLKMLAESKTGASPKDLVQALFGAVRGFAGAEEQSDDITVLALQYRGPAKTQAPASAAPSTEAHTM